MLIDMRTHDMDLVGAIQRHLEKRVRAALASSAAQVRSVTIELTDINGPRGGADLRCAVTVDLLPRGSVRAEATDADLGSAVGRALAWARRRIRLETKRDHRERVRPLEPPEPAAHHAK